ncbi:MAG: response regulator transcription factor [Nitriliruptoraceae bacterium]
MSMRVVIADDHALVRQSIVKAVNAEPGLEVVAEVADGLAALQAVATHEPDLIVLDIAMPGKDGLAVAEQLRAQHPGTAVLFLSMHDDDASLQRALAIGARGFVSKSASVDELLDALRAMQTGGSYLSSGVATRVMDIAAGRTRSSDLGLTAREREVLDLLIQGKRPGEIGDALFLSVKTVKNHLTSIYQKLEVETGAQAVAEAYRLGLAQRS